MNTFTAADDHKGDDNGDNSGDDNNDDKTPGGDSNNGQHSGGSSGSSGRGSSSVSTSTSGSWTTDVNGWKYRKPDGSYVKSGWEQILWNQQYNWYHFDENGYCQGGWFTDTDGMIYYLYNVHDGEFGRMYTGWNVIDGKYYYFEPVAGNKQGHLYRNTTTPDGYQVADDGTWIQ